MSENEEKILTVNSGENFLVKRQYASLDGEVTIPVPFSDIKSVKCTLLQKNIPVANAHYEYSAETETFSEGMRFDEELLEFVVEVSQELSATLKAGIVEAEWDAMILNPDFLLNGGLQRDIDTLEVAKVRESV